MTTIAQKAGIFKGKKYKVTADEYHMGKVVTLVEDDDTVIPYFREVFPDGTHATDRICLNVQEDGLVLVEDADGDFSYNIDVSSAGTVVKTSRKLTLAQIKAIMEIIGD